MEFFRTFGEMLSVAGEAVCGFFGDRSPLVLRSTLADYIAECYEIRRQREEAIDQIAAKERQIVRLEQEGRATEDRLERLRDVVATAKRLQYEREAEADRLKKAISDREFEIARLKRMRVAAIEALTETSEA